MRFNGDRIKYFLYGIGGKHRLRLLIVIITRISKINDYFNGCLTAGSVSGRQMYLSGNITTISSKTGNIVIDYIRNFITPLNYLFFILGKIFVLKRKLINFQCDFEIIS